MLHHTEQIGTALLISTKQCTYMNYKLNLYISKTEILSANIEVSFPKSIPD